MTTMEAAKIISDLKAIRVTAAKYPYGQTPRNETAIRALDAALEALRVVMRVESFEAAQPPNLHLMDLSTRAMTALWQEGIRSVEELVKMDEYYIAANISGAGHGVAAEIVDKARRLAIRPEETPGSSMQSEYLRIPKIPEVSQEAATAPTPPFARKNAASDVVVIKRPRGRPPKPKPHVEPSEPKHETDAVAQPNRPHRTNEPPKKSRDRTFLAEYSARPEAGKPTGDGFAAEATEPEAPSATEALHPETLPADQTKPVETEDDDTSEATDADIDAKFFAEQAVNKNMSQARKADEAQRAQDRAAFIQKKRENYAALVNFRKTHPLGCLKQLATASHVEEQNIRAMLNGERRPMALWEKVIQGIKKIEAEEK